MRTPPANSKLLLLVATFVAQVVSIPTTLEARQSCANIGGVWQVKEEATLACTVTVGGQTFSESDPLDASNNIDIIQNSGSCSFRYDPGTIPSRGVSRYYRTEVTGDIVGNTVTTSGGNLIPAPGAQLIQASFSATGQVSGNSMTLSGSGPQKLNQRVEGGLIANLDCTLTSTAVFTRATQPPAPPAPPPPVSLTLVTGGTRTTSTSGIPANIRSGYATATVETGVTPYGTAVFSLTQNGVVVSEAAVPASPPTQRARIFADYRTGVPAGVGTLNIYTGLAVANRGSSPATLIYTLRDRDGQIVATGQSSLAARAHFAKFIQELRDVAPDFNLPASFATATRFGSMDITSSQPVSIVALRLTNNQRGETLLTSTPIADVSAPVTNSPLYFPQLADGGGYATTLILLNTSSTTESGTFAIFDDNGIALALRESGGATGSTFPYSIPAGGAFVFQTDGSPAAARVGWVKLTPNTGSPSPVGAGVFSYSQAGILVTESGVPSAIPTTSARIFVDKSGGHDTGLAIANPGGSVNTIFLQAFQNNGSTPAGNGQATLSIPSSGHAGKFVGQMIGGLPDGFTGVLRISAASPFVALTMRSLSNRRGDFLLTTFPIADASQPAPAPIVFPQIADGGGYKTQFIFISATGSATVSVNFVGDDGSPLNVGTVSP